LDHESRSEKITALSFTLPMAVDVSGSFYQVNANMRVMYGALDIGLFASTSAQKRGQIEAQINLSFNASVLSTKSSLSQFNVDLPITCAANASKYASALAVFKLPLTGDLTAFKTSTLMALFNMPIDLTGTYINGSAPTYEYTIKINGKLVVHTINAVTPLVRIHASTRSI
jgi:hypothetical protein